MRSRVSSLHGAHRDDNLAPFRVDYVRTFLIKIHDNSCHQWNRTVLSSSNPENAVCIHGNILQAVAKRSVGKIEDDAGRIFGGLYRRLNSSIQRNRDAQVASVARRRHALHLGRILSCGTRQQEQYDS